MKNDEIKDPFDLGSDPVEDGFDPFALDDDEGGSDNEIEETPEQSTPPTPATQESPKSKTSAKAQESKESKAEQTLEEKLPVFDYAGATENITDVSKTFDELRIEKANDFPELEDGKKVSWSVEYGKVTRNVADPKGISIGKMKSDIETSKDFTDSLKKPKADKNPICKIKPRVNAQSKGTKASYRGVFINMEEADMSGKAISIVPSRDGRVYEIRDNALGRFITPVTGCDLLSEIRAGFVPALPLIPMRLMMEIIAFFRSYTINGMNHEVLVNIYWDTQNEHFIADAPEQFVTKISADGIKTPEYSEDRYVHYMDVHSHNSMDAFFSNTDDRDEKATRIYSVIGRLDKYFPTVKTRISNGGKFWEIDPAEVFEMITVTFPDEWKTKVKFHSNNYDHDIMSRFAYGADTR